LAERLGSCCFFPELVSQLFNMPEQSYPPYADGALIVPRQLYRWIDINPQGGRLQRTMSYITLPAFTATKAWGGVTEIVASFNFECPNNFSLRNVTGLPVNAVGTVLTSYPTSPNYTLCISYRVGTKLTRYMIWSGDGTVLPGSVVYTGQPILKNCRFEIWNTSKGLATESTTYNFYTSVRGKYDYRYGSDAALVANDGQVTNFASSSSFNNLITDGTTSSNPFFFVTCVPGTLHYYYQGNSTQLQYSAPSSTILTSSGSFTPYSADLAVYPAVPNGTLMTTAIYTSIPLPLTFPTNSVSVTN